MQGSTAKLKHRPKEECGARNMDSCVKSKKNDDSLLQVKKIK
jgi:hypothetical protein